MSHEPCSSAPPAGAPWPPSAPLAGRNPSRLLPILGVVLGLLGLVAGTAAWFRAAPSDSGGPSYSAQQVADAKKAVCEAYAKGVEALQVAGAKKADPADWLPVAVNTRLAETAMGNYLSNVLAANPAAPAELQGLTHQLALNYQEMAVIQLADRMPPEFESNRVIADDLIPKIDRSCR